MGNCLTNCCYGCMYFSQQMYENYIRDRKGVQIVLGIVGGMLLMVILLAIFGAFRHKCYVEGDDDIYYNVYSKSWPQTVCKTLHNGQCADILPKTLTIHGLLPHLVKKPAFVTNCHDNDDYDSSKLNPLSAKLNAQWPSVAQGNNQNDHLWNLQWNIHGRCSKLKLVEYFETALALDDKYPIQKWLDDAGLKPANDKVVKKANFDKVLTDKAGGKNFLLRCANVTTSTMGNNGFWLEDVSVCVKYSDSVTLVECKQGVIEEKRKCPDEFYFVESYKPPTTVPPTAAPTTMAPTTVAPTTLAPATTHATLGTTSATAQPGH